MASDPDLIAAIAALQSATEALQTNIDLERNRHMVLASGPLLGLADDEALFDVHVPFPAYLKANLDECLVSADAPPAFEQTFPIDKTTNGGATWLPLGLITIATTGAVTLASEGGIARTVAAGERLRLRAPIEVSDALGALHITITLTYGVIF